MTSTQPGIHLTRILSLVAVYVLLFLAIILNLRSIQPSLHELLDFGSFIAAGKESVLGKNPYAEDLPLVYSLESPHTGQSLPSPNLNPPISIFFFRFFSRVDPLKAVASWRILTTLLFVTSVFILARAFRFSGKPTRILWALSLAGFWNTILLGQIYVPLLILGIGVWLLAERQYYKLAGLALGFLVAIKPNFAFWLFLLGMGGYLTVALSAGMVALFLSILPLFIWGPEIFEQWLAALSHYPSIGLLIAGNSSFQSLTVRFGSGLSGTVISLLFICGSLYLTHRYKISLSKINTLGIVGSLLVSPFSWVGYTVLTLPIFFSRSKWNWQYKLAAVLLAFPYILVMYFFQKSFLYSLLFGWLYGWGLLLLVFGSLSSQDDKPLNRFHFTENRT